MHSVLGSRMRYECKYFGWIKEMKCTNNLFELPQWLFEHNNWIFNAKSNCYSLKIMRKLFGIVLWVYTENFTMAMIPSDYSFLHSTQHSTQWLMRTSVIPITMNRKCKLNGCNARDERHRKWTPKNTRHLTSPSANLEQMFELAFLRFYSEWTNKQAKQTIGEFLLQNSNIVRLVHLQ